MNRYQLSWLKPVLLALALSVGAAVQIRAQEILIPESEVSVYLKGPFSKVSLDVGDAGENNNRFGLGVGVQYAHYFNLNWSVSGGLEFQTYRSEALFDSFSDAYAATDVEGDNFQFRYQLDAYQERLNMALINIPIRVQYEDEFTKHFMFYGSVGVAVGFPLVAKYKSRAFGLTTAGYYQQWDALLNSPRFMGFGNWGNQSTGKQELDPKTSFSLLLETGLKHKISVGHNLYFGIFADIPLNKLNKSGDDVLPLIEYDPAQPTSFIYNSVITAAPGAQGDTYADKMKALAFGVKLRYSFDF
ncbi:outer membrane beta-barrel protein [Mangrovibacterium marinum]|uniref:Outer membrane protein with beta-barrel domain n=1 Tax=Mangrovibacterium marinum TaxID=1639118 RepID=A0A2T5C017_9BACT|nr:outer membrane beta-barrel protein [Mangrovibacterium marinum]PTN07903.1 outer membrane protein with beta-barrel domain [Mangrovibacterium marinum]